MRSALMICALAASPAAGAPVLEFPVDCTLGTTCYVEDYLDHDASDARKDFACGLNTRDAHGGTDIALLSFEAMERGVDVLAAAPGTVIGTRDSMADTRDANVPSNIACGNGVRIDHGDGWHSQYCHLKLGSVSVRQGDEVRAGTVLGQIGLSGQSNHPHLHLSLEHQGKDVDPFAVEGAETCGEDTTQMWADPLPYYDTGFYTAAFANAVPTLEDARTGAKRRTTSKPDQPLVLYGYFYLAKPGDRLEFTAHGPGGTIFGHDLDLGNPRKSHMQAYGRRAPAGGWPAGFYEGTVRLMRGDTLIALRHSHITVRD